MAWKKGVSGNPNGRPAHPLAEQFRETLEPRLDEVIKAMIDAAANGDAQAAKLLLDRVLPPFKPIPRTEAFPISGQSLTEKAESILNAVSAGILPPLEGKALIDSLIGISKLVEIEELEHRISVLEGKL